MAAAKAIGQILDACAGQDPATADLTSVFEMLYRTKLELEEPISYLRTRRGSTAGNEDKRTSFPMLKRTKDAAGKEATTLVSAQQAIRTKRRKSHSGVQQFEYAGRGVPAKSLVLWNPEKGRQGGF